MHCGKKWGIREFVAPYIFPLNPHYVAARSLRSLRSNEESDSGQTITAKKTTKSLISNQKTQEYIKGKCPLFILSKNK